MLWPIRWWDKFGRKVRRQVSGLKNYIIYIYIKAFFKSNSLQGDRDILSLPFKDYSFEIGDLQQNRYFCVIFFPIFKAMWPFTAGSPFRPCLCTAWRMALSRWWRCVRWRGPYPRLTLNSYLWPDTWSCKISPRNSTQWSRSLSKNTSPIQTLKVRIGIIITFKRASKQKKYLERFSLINLFNNVAEYFRLFS